MVRWIVCVLGYDLWRPETIIITQDSGGSIQRKSVSSSKQKRFNLFCFQENFPSFLETADRETLIVLL